MQRDPKRNLVELETRLDAGQPAAARWWYGWIGAYTALTIGQSAVFAASSDPSLRANMLVGAGGSLLGVVCTLGARLPAIDAGDQLHAASRGDDASRVALGERLLDESAEAELLGRSWIAHGLGLLVASAQGLVLWQGYGLRTDGAVSFVSGLAISELQILSQPTRAIDDRDEYRRGRSATSKREEPQLRIALLAGAAVIGGSF